MVDRLARIIGFEIAFCDVGIVCGVVYQNVIPGFVQRGIGPGHLPVPFFGTLKHGINVHDNAAIVEQFVVNQFTGEETRLLHRYFA